MRMEQVLVLLSVLIASCATYDQREVVQALPESQNASSQLPALDSSAQATEPAQRVWKQKVALARFTNETKYGSGLFVEKNRGITTNS